MLPKKIKFWVNVVTVVALLLLAFISRDQIRAAFNELADLSVWLLALQVPVQLLSYNSVAHLYYSYLNGINRKGELKLADSYKIALELNFVNSVFPSGGVSGFSYLGLRLRQFDVRVATSTMAQVVRYALTFASFILILGLGLFLLAIGNQANGLVILIGSAIFFSVIILGTLGLYVVSDERRIKSFVAVLPKALNSVTKKIIPKRDKDLVDLSKVEDALGEMHDRYLEMKDNLSILKWPFIYALAVNAFELMTIYLVYVALGEYVNPGAVILAYAVANFAGLVAILPGGVGVYESLMAAVLAASGVPQGLAISATIIYRVINLLVFVPIGYFFYHAALNGRRSTDGGADGNSSS